MSIARCTTFTASSQQQAESNAAKTTESTGSRKKALIPEKIRQHAFEGRKVCIIGSNDAFADADSLQAFLDTLIAAKRLKEQYSQAQIEIVGFTTDEFNKETLENCHLSYQGTENKGGALGAHYQQQLSQPDSFLSSHLPYRVQDAATVLFPVAERLEVSLTLHPGDIRRKQKEEYVISGAGEIRPKQKEETVKFPDVRVIENSNPYFGNFGKGLGEKDQEHIKKISERKFIEIIEEKIGDRKSLTKEERRKKCYKVYIINGGSLTLLSELGNQRPDLAKCVNVVLAAFKQPHRELPRDAFSPSHNESLNIRATQAFLPVAENFKRVEVIDSGSGYYSAKIDGEIIKSFEEHLQSSGLDKVLSKGAFDNLVETEKRHFERYGNEQNKTKFNDSMMVAYLMGDITIPMLTSTWKRQGIGNYCLVPNQEGGYLLTMPYIEAGEFSGNPYSHILGKTPPNAPQIALANDLQEKMVAFVQKEAEFLRPYLE